MTGNLVPREDDTTSLGTTQKRWVRLFLSEGLYTGDALVPEGNGTPLTIQSGNGLTGGSGGLIQLIAGEGQNNSNGGDIRLVPGEHSGTGTGVGGNLVFGRTASTSEDGYQLFCNSGSDYPAGLRYNIVSGLWQYRADGLTAQPWTDFGSGSGTTSSTYAPKWIKVPIGTGTTQSTATIPAGATILQVSTNITTPYNSGTTIEVGLNGSTPITIQDDSENNPTSASTFTSEPYTDITSDTAGVVLITIANATQGAGDVLVEFVDNFYTGGGQPGTGSIDPGTLEYQIAQWHEASEKWVPSNNMTLPNTGAGTRTIQVASATAAMNLAVRPSSSTGSGVGGSLLLEGGNTVSTTAAAGNVEITPGSNGLDDYGNVVLSGKNGSIVYSGNTDTLGVQGTATFNLNQGFKIGGVTTSSNVTSANLNTLTGGGDASALHAHATVTPSAVGFMSPAMLSTLNAAASQTYVDENTYRKVSSASITAGSWPMDLFPTDMGDAAHWTYVLKSSNGTNLRTGIMMAVWDQSGQVEFSEPTTNNIGDTDTVNFYCDIDNQRVRLMATVGGGSWTVKLARILL